MAKYRQFMKNQVTELLTNYGKIDIIWFDFSFPGKNGKSRYDCDSEGLVRLAKKLQPEIIIDNRLDLTDWEDGWDFATPEQARWMCRSARQEGSVGDVPDVLRELGLCARRVELEERLPVHRAADRRRFKGRQRHHERRADGDWRVRLSSSRAPCGLRQVA